MLGESFISEKLAGSSRITDNILNTHRVFLKDNVTLEEKEDDEE